jgi:hypothetical protein
MVAQLRRELTAEIQARHAEHQRAEAAERRAKAAEQRAIAAEEALRLLEQQFETFKKWADSNEAELKRQLRDYRARVSIMHAAADRRANIEKSFMETETNRTQRVTKSKAARAVDKLVREVVLKADHDVDAGATIIASFLDSPLIEDAVTRLVTTPADQLKQRGFVRKLAGDYAIVDRLRASVTLLKNSTMSNAAYAAYQTVLTAIAPDSGDAADLKLTLSRLDLTSSTAMIGAARRRGSIFSDDVDDGMDWTSNKQWLRARNSTPDGAALCQAVIDKWDSMTQASSNTSDVRAIPRLLALRQCPQ